MIQSVMFNTEKRKDKFVPVQFVTGSQNIFPLLMRNDVSPKGSNKLLNYGLA